VAEAVAEVEEGEGDDELDTIKKLGDFMIMMPAVALMKWNRETWVHSQGAEATLAGSVDMIKESPPPFLQACPNMQLYQLPRQQKSVSDMCLELFNSKPPIQLNHRVQRPETLQ
jgi:hypothetical protein